MKKILWLASWYPNRVEPLNGDFIERHARAVSLLHYIYVVHVVKDHLQVTPGEVFTEQRTYNDRFHATVIYYKIPFKVRWVNRLLSAYRFLSLFLSAAKQYIAREGKPHLIHVHVSLNAGFVALFLKWFYKIPYVVTEHWTGFCAEAKPNFREKSWFTRFMWKRVMKNASGLTTVSQYLGEAIKTRISSRSSLVIPNVVDTTIFMPLAREETDFFWFIHISTLGDQKNPREILQGIQILSSVTTRKFKLIIYGPEKPELISLSQSLNIQEYVIFKKEASQLVLSQDMTQADALILYSSFETFGCVIIEANACGIPVIASDIPVLHENVLDGLTGIFVPLHSPAALAEKMLWMMNNKKIFDPPYIAEFATSGYSFSKVAAHFDSFYKSILTEING